MIDKLTLSADAILAITQPEKLFTKEEYSKEFLRLRKHWHPDVNDDPKANDVFIHIISLAEEAKTKILTDSWNGDATLHFNTSSKNYRLKYHKCRDFELGKMYIGSTTVAYVLDEANEDLFKNGVRAVKGIKYPKAKFKEEFAKLFPNIKFHDKTDIGHVVVMDKPKGSVLLQDLIDYMPPNTIDPKHVAWIVSSLYNIATFLDFVGISHNSILPTTVFVDPEKHSVSLLGGWWYSVNVGSKLKAIPTELTKVLPSEVFKEKTAKSSYDRLAVKGVAIGCLGDPTLVGSKLLVSKDIPKPLLNWIRTPSSGTAVEEYTGWDTALEKSFGKKKFIKFDFDITKIY